MLFFIKTFFEAIRQCLVTQSSLTFEHEVLEVEQLGKYIADRSGVVVALWVKQVLKTGLLLSLVFVNVPVDAAAAAEHAHVSQRENPLNRKVKK